MSRSDFCGNIVIFYLQLPLGLVLPFGAWYNLLNSSVRHGLVGKGRSYRAGWALVGKTDAILGKSALSSLKIKIGHD